VAQSHTPQDCCVRFAGVVTFPDATLATGRCATILPGPDLHRLERASFAWRTKNRLLGRRNWLFAGSHSGGERAAAMYSILQTAKLNGINPQAYLTDTLSRIAAGLRSTASQN
jgi:glyoxylase-like metal-dependent hydrolase (beta-lactamase superfamily II)